MDTSAETGPNREAAWADVRMVVSGSAAASTPLLPDRGLYAVEPAVLRRALGDALCDEGPLPPQATAVGRTLAAFLGCGRRAGDTAEPLPVERLVHELGHELWFLGSFSAGVAVRVLVRLGADADEASALLDGQPVAARLEPPQAAHAVRTFPAALSVLDGSRAGEWRRMLRAALAAFEGAKPALRAEVAACVGLGVGAGAGEEVDRYVFALLASLMTVVDFAEDGHEVLVAAAP